MFHVRNKRDALVFVSRSHTIPTAVQRSFLFAHQWRGSDNAQQYGQKDDTMEKTEHDYEQENLWKSGHD